MIFKNIKTYKEHLPQLNIVNFNNSNILNENSIIKDDISNLINEFGFFITMNLSQITKMGKDTHSTDELILMMSNIRKPIINGKTYTELINNINYLYENPKILSEFLNKIREYLLYIEPRIERFVKDSDVKKNWLEKINKLKTNYKNIISNIK